MTIPKRFLATIIFFFLLMPVSLFIRPPSAYASYSPASLKTNYQAIFEQNVFGSDDINQPSYINETTMATIGSLNNMILGCSTQTCQKKLGDRGRGAIGGIGNLITILYTNPPASSAYYLADLGQRFNLVQPAYAQGVGFSGLHPLLSLWRASRDIAYIFFILVFVATGFAIMFRTKINPQTVVTLEAAIPRVVIALILVTFSYAIAGLIIDLMYLVIGLSLAMLISFAHITLPHSIPAYYGLGFGDLLHDVWTTGWGNLFKILGSYLPWVEGGLGATAGIGTVIGAIVGGGLIPAGMGLLAGSAGVGGLFLLIIAIIILYAVFKIFLMLLQAYVSIIISIIIAPFQLMISAIPGQNTFGPWITNLIKNILIFPTIMLMLVLANYLSGISGNLWVPPMLGSFGQATGKAAGAILGFGIVLMTPKTADIIKSVFERKPFPYGTAIGQAMGPARGIGGTAKLYGAGETARWFKRTGKAGTTRPTWRATVGGVIEKVTGVRSS